MITLEQTRNGCDSAQLLALSPASSMVAISPRAIQGGVEKPGGLFNTYCLTGPGGLLNNPGGFSTESLGRLD